MSNHPTPVPPPSAAELTGAIRVREDVAAELSAAGDYRGAARHWRVAEELREMRRDAA